ncbi:DUF2085 domain-containing protein [Chondromyces crocatus]|uniref:DUF2085 domain-containing protein n=1 Tax=Chondromyces crocatus TaxID=52 RepID=A0A0K1E631_CHOCO|nr:DUF2085 domain-containing protein [Chondromyces crocatus]AKT36309.1 uncharacterized protein CMC5_004230 [Chondromyces crocatus]
MTCPDPQVGLRDDCIPRSEAAARREAQAVVLATMRMGLVLIGVLPWGLPVARAYFELGVVGDALDRMFAPMCHRLPERTLVVTSVLMPVCSRCAGIFSGLVVGAMIARPLLSMRTWRVLLCIASAAMVGDVVIQELGIRPLSHSARLATGFSVGYCMAVAFVTHVSGERA